MSLTRRKFIIHSSATAAALALWKSRSYIADADLAESKPPPETTTLGPPPTPGKFEPNWESLSQYKCPEWFRDAKLGLWAHWCAQCVPETGFWYARYMYVQGSDDYKYQLANYGHPSKVGFKDLDQMWHAENWNPKELIARYKRAGAKYFVALANHHDNFDTWNSKYQPWNSVNLGPKKNIVGIWEREAREAGLKFGVTVHAARAWSWFETAQGADRDGPLAGVPYDGKLTKADGAGKWWEGYDPQDLYAQAHVPGGGDAEGDPGKNPPDKAYCDKFYNRTVDLIRQHNPDLLYFDDYTMPLNQVSDVGLRLAAEYYNYNTKRNGTMTAVFNTKRLNALQRKALVEDYERGSSDAIKPEPWQTDTCIGNWWFNRGVSENNAYKTPRLVVRMLVDIVSKNGNLLLNIPVRADGTIDEHEIAFLDSFGAWIEVNGDSIFATRPWKLFGEGTLRKRGGDFTEGVEDRFSSEDFRFVTKGNVLYATVFGWTDGGKWTIRTLADGLPGIKGDVKTVTLLGHKEPLSFKRTLDGLVVDIPATKPCDYAWVMKIEGLDLAESEPVEALPKPIKADDYGTWVLLPQDATLNGRLQEQGGDPPNIGYWDSSADTATWSVDFPSAGTYSFSCRLSAAVGNTTFVLDAGSGPSPSVAVAQTDSWYNYAVVSGSGLKVTKPGVAQVTVRAADPASWKAMNLASVTLRRTSD